MATGTNSPATGGVIPIVRRAVAKQFGVDGAPSQRTVVLLARGPGAPRPVLLTPADTGFGRMGGPEDAYVFQQAVAYLEAQAERAVPAA
jgi:hypothetical protein